MSNLDKYFADDLGADRPYQPSEDGWSRVSNRLDQTEIRMRFRRKMFAAAAVGAIALTLGGMLAWTSFELREVKREMAQLRRQMTETIAENSVSAPKSTSDLPVSPEMTTPQTASAPSPTPPALHNAFENIRPQNQAKNIAAQQAFEKHRKNDNDLAKMTGQQRGDSEPAFQVAAVEAAMQSALDQTADVQKNAQLNAPNALPGLNWSKVQSIAPNKPRLDENRRDQPVNAITKIAKTRKEPRISVGPTAFYTGLRADESQIKKGYGVSALVRLSAKWQLSAHFGQSESDYTVRMKDLDDYHIPDPPGHGGPGPGPGHDWLKKVSVDQSSYAYSVGVRWKAFASRYAPLYVGAAWASDIENTTRLEYQIRDHQTGELEYIQDTRPKKFDNQPLQMGGLRLSLSTTIKPVRRLALDFELYGEKARQFELSQTPYAFGLKTALLFNI